MPSSRILPLALLVALLLPGETQAQTDDMHEVPIVDPVLQMTAYTLTVPAGWHVVGTVLPPSSCYAGTPPVYKATSPDGSAGRYLLPSTTWAWGAISPKRDCTLAQRAVSAEDFLTYYVRHRNVGIVKTMPTPDFQHYGAPLHGESVDQAAYLVRYSLGKSKKPMEETIQDTVVCSAYTSLGVGEYHVCAATITLAYAPLGKLNAMLPTFRAMKLTLNQPWMDAWTSAMRTRVNGLYAGQTRAMLQQGAIAGAQRMRAHQDYMASMQAGADARDLQFKAGQYQKQNNSDNYIDYILDCQRSYSGGTRISDYDCPNRQTF